MNVAMVKLASTKRKRMPQHGGTAGQMVTASHGHLNMQTQDKEGKRGNTVYHHSSPGVPRFTLHTEDLTGARQASVPRRSRLTQITATAKDFKG